MADINQVIIKGRMADKPEARKTTNGKMVCNFTVATSRIWNEKEYTEWHRCVVWGALADGVASFDKGTPVLAEGNLRTSSYEKDGNTIYKTEVVVDSIGKIAFSQREEGESRGSSRAGGPPGSFR
jgi:single-strand DNA-binding protein